MASILGDGTGPGGPGTSRCLLLLQRSLAIQLTRGPPPHVANASQRESPKEHPADEMWMYDKGYNLFQVSRVYLYLCLSYNISISSILSHRHASLSNFSLFDKHAFVTSACTFSCSGNHRRRKTLRKRTSEKKTRRSSTSRLRRDSVLFVSPALFFHLLSTHESFTVKQTLITRTVTPRRDNVNYEQFRKSKHNRGAAG